MAKKKIKIRRPKVRRTWKINPATRIKRSKKVYDRSREKEKLREILDEGEGGDSVNKAELVMEVAEKTKLSRKDARAAVDAALETIRENVKEGVRLVGFGTFFVVQRKARKGRNPQTGEEISIGAKRVIKFRPGKVFREMV